MTIKTTEAQHADFLRLHEAGASYKEIGQRYGLHAETVRYWTGRLPSRTRAQEQVVRRSGVLSRFDPEIKERLLRLHQAHPATGADLLLARLKAEFKAEGEPYAVTAQPNTPSRTTVERLLAGLPDVRRRRVKREKVAAPAMAQQVHECWEIDVKTDIQLENGTLLNLLTVREVRGEVCVTAELLDAGYRSPGSGGRSRRVTFAELRQVLRGAFVRYATLPDAIQTDSEVVFVGEPTRIFPAPFTLWLVGLGIKQRVIQHGKPQQNGAVERAHQTLYKAVIVGQEHQPPATLRADLAGTLDTLANDFPSRARECKQRPPHTAHPELLHPRRPYTQEQEATLFRIERVHDYLAGFIWRRKLSDKGQVSLGGNDTRYNLGVDQTRFPAGSTVLARFDPNDQTFVFHVDPQPQILTTDPTLALGDEIVRKPVRNLSPKDLCGSDLEPSPPCSPLALTATSVALSPP